MNEIIIRAIDLAVNFINSLFLFQIELETGEWIPIGKIILAVTFVMYTIYFILDAIGILDKGDDY